MIYKYFYIVFLFVSPGLFGQDYFNISPEVNRIVFLGNSITYRGLYVSYIETYLTLKDPERSMEYINVGLPSENVSGLSEPGHANGAFPRPDLHERLDRVLEQTEPDLIFACYGMNDVIKQPFNDKIFRKYRKGIEWLHDEVLASGAKIVHLTPPVYDPVKGAYFSNVLDIYSDWLISKRYTDDWEVVNLHWPMKKFLEEERETDPTFFLARDAVHPDETGHWLMAREVLLFLGHTELKDTESIHEALAQFDNGDAVLELVEQRQNIMKDAWLTATGHKRPLMKVGLPLEEAKTKYEEIQYRLEELLKLK